MAKKTTTLETTGGEHVVISAPNMRTVSFLIEGDTPYVQNKFSGKARGIMRAKQEAGSTGGKNKKREAKDFLECCEEAKHYSDEGWIGLPASAFRLAAISACRVVGFKMTVAKLSIFIEADGFDKDDGTPLVKITKGEPRYAEHAVRNETGVCDIRPRPLWNPGWQAVVRMRFDADQFTVADVSNLMARIGCQVGIGEGRPDSKKSGGMGWGLFHLKNEKNDAS